MRDYESRRSIIESFKDERRTIAAGMFSRQPITPNCASSDMQETASESIATAIDKTFSTESRRDLRSAARVYSRNALTSSRLCSKSSAKPPSSLSSDGSAASMASKSGRKLSTTEEIEALNDEISDLIGEFSRLSEKRRRSSVLSSFTLATCAISFIAVLVSYLFPHPVMLFVDGALIVLIILIGVPLFVWEWRC